MGVGTWFLTRMKKPVQRFTLEIPRNPPNPVLSPAPFASEAARFCPVLEPHFRLLAEDGLSAHQLI